MRRWAAAALPLALGGCMDVAIPVPQPGLALNPVAFFTGRSVGQGRLHTILRSTTPIHVQSVGRPDGKGGLVLVQLIREGAKRPRQRIWTLRPTGPGAYTGELTDARGSVQVQTGGGSALIRYEMKNGMRVEQMLALRKDGREIANRLYVYRFGIQLAQLDETIRKLN